MDMTPSHIEIQYASSRPRWVGNIEQAITPCASKEEAEALAESEGGFVVCRTVVVTDWAPVEVEADEPW